MVEMALVWREKKKITDHVGPSNPVEEESIWVHFKSDKDGYAAGLLNTHTQVKKAVRKISEHSYSFNSYQQHEYFYTERSRKSTT